MKKLLLLLSFLAVPLAAQGGGMVVRLVAVCGTGVTLQTTSVFAVAYMDTTGHFCTNASGGGSGGNPTAGYLDSIGILKELRKVDSINLVDSITTLHHIARVDTLAFVKRSVDSIIYLPAGGYGDSIRVVQKAELDSGISSVQTGSLGSLGATVTLFPQGKPYVSFAVDSSLSLHGVVVVEIETNAADTNWDSRYFWNGDACRATDSLPNANGINKREYTVPIQETAVAVRLRVSGYTSGHANGIIRAGYLNAQAAMPISCSYAIDSTLAPGGGYSGEVASPVVTEIGGRTEDSPARGRMVTVMSGTPAFADARMVVQDLGQSRWVAASIGSDQATIIIRTDGFAGVGAEITSSSLLGTLNWEESADSSNWNSTTGINSNLLGSGTVVNPAAGGEYTFTLGSDVRWLRVRIHPYTSGSTLISLIASKIISPVGLNPTLYVNALTSPYFGGKVGGSIAGAGTGADLKLRVTTPAVTDTGLIVILQPNSSLGLVKQVDSLNLLDSITTLHNVTLVRQVDSLNLVDSITAISHVTTVTTVGTVNVSTQRVSDTVYCAAGAKSAADSVVLPSYGGSTLQYVTWLYVAETDTLGITGTGYDSLTTTNFPIPLLRFGNAAAVGGTNIWLSQTYPNPMHSVATATATKFRLSAPGAGGYWDLCVGYYHQ